MKKLLFLLLLFPLALLSQNKIVIKSTQVTISSLAPIAANTLVANNSSGIATPTAVPLAIGLKFYPGVGLGIDTLNFKDTIYAKNGTQIIGTGFNQIGLGGFLSQNTNISGSNAWDLTIDSMQANVSRGFRVNFGSDAGWDMIVRDSATGHWTRIPKGTVGQSFQMLGVGGVGWANQSGGGGLPVIQTITVGPTVTINDATDILQVNATSIITSLAVTLPTNWPTNKQVKICFTANGTITSGNTMVTSLTIIGGSGQTLSQAINPNGSSVLAGENIVYQEIGTVDQRLQ